MARKTDSLPLGASLELEPNTALIEEIKRTAGHVAKLGEIVQALAPAELVEGVTRTVIGPEGETTVTTETAPNVWLRLYQMERKHLLDACRTASGTGVRMASPEKEKGPVDEMRARREARIAGGAGT